MRPTARVRAIGVTALLVAAVTAMAAPVASAKPDPASSKPGGPGSTAHRPTSASVPDTATTAATRRASRTHPAGKDRRVPRGLCVSYQQASDRARIRSASFARLRKTAIAADASVEGTPTTAQVQAAVARLCDGVLQSAAAKGTARRSGAPTTGPDDDAGTDKGSDKGSDTQADAQGSSTTTSPPTSPSPTLPTGATTTTTVSGRP